VALSNDGLKDLVETEGRAADRLQDTANRRLPFERLVGLRQQPTQPDRHRRLIGEEADDLNLLGR